ncbi:MAG: bis(5'-nucleosyl)-tetraphosphatase (symmetrical) YqeK [Acholeplasmatales bacterium]|nr:bis(5'-nucleosyl)-tetraphosphatase (symmetrical) YqeK [Acholeplasmatales bacterium]
MDFLELLKEKYGSELNRITHSIGVKDLAVELCKKFNIDPIKGEIAALFHDYYRYEDNDTLISLMDKKDYETYKDMPWGYHGLAAGNKIKDFGIKDIDIINAIKYHTLGRKNMSMLEKIIYVSDFCEINRTHEGSKEVRDLVLTDFNKAFLLTLEYTYKHTKDLNVKELLDYYGGLNMKEVELVVSEIDKLNMQNIKVYDLSNRSPLFDYVVIASATNDRQANAIIKNLRELELKGDIQIKGIEDQDDAWILLDLKDIIVHIFNEETRAYYGLDEIYSPFLKD